MTTTPKVGDVVQLMLEHHPFEGEALVDDNSVGVVTDRLTDWSTFCFVEFPFKGQVLCLDISA